jgi:hypothetical protein
MSEIYGRPSHERDPKRRWLRHTYQDGFQHIPALRHLDAWLAELMAAA